MAAKQKPPVTQTNSPPKTSTIPHPASTKTNAPPTNLEATAQAKKPGTALWEFETGNLVSSSPAIGSDDTVYVGSYDKKLYAIRTGSKGLAKSPWPMRGQNVLHTGRVMKK